MDQATAFERWGRVVYRRRRRILMIALVGVAVALVWGTGILGSSSPPGVTTPPGPRAGRPPAWPPRPSAGTPVTWWSCTPAR